jgi:uncharacterized protein
MSRYVIDTNVLVSAGLFDCSVPRQSFERVLRYGKVLISQPVINELQEVFRRSRFDKYASLNTRLKFIANILEISEMVEIKEVITICRDPKDDKFLELAINGSANFLITGDRDLLVLNPFREILNSNSNRFFAIILSRLRFTSKIKI